MLGQDSGRAGVTFLGTERIDVLRFGPDGDGVTRYVTLGASRAPMTDPASPLVDPIAGPRAELVLSVRGRPDSVLRRLAVLAAAPAVEGIVLAPGTVVEVGEPLWDGARFSAVLIAEPGGLVADLDARRGTGSRALLSRPAPHGQRSGVQAPAWGERARGGLAARRHRSARPHATRATCRKREVARGSRQRDSRAGTQTGRGVVRGASRRPAHIERRRKRNPGPVVAAACSQSPLSRSSWDALEACASSHVCTTNLRCNARNPGTGITLARECKERK